MHCLSCWMVNMKVTAKSAHFRPVLSVRQIWLPTVKFLHHAAIWNSLEWNLYSYWLRSSNDLWDFIFGVWVYATAARPPARLMFQVCPFRYLTWLRRSCNRCCRIWRSSWPQMWIVILWPYNSWRCLVWYAVGSVSIICASSKCSFQPVGM